MEKYRQKRMRITLLKFHKIVLSLANPFRKSHERDFNIDFMTRTLERHAVMVVITMEGARCRWYVGDNIVLIERLGIIVASRSKASNTLAHFSSNG